MTDSVANLVDDTLFNSPTPSVTTSCPARLYVLNDVTKLQQYQGETVNIAVVYSSYPSVYKRVYFDGVFFKSMPMNSTFFNSLGNTTAYLGRNATTNVNSGKGLDAQFNEFRIYFGELSNDDIKNAFLIGTDPSHVTISSDNTLSNVYLTFYSISQVNLDVQFQGGSSGPVNNTLNGVTTSFLYNMFGSESSFQLSPVDAQCAYTPVFSLDPTTSSTNNIKVPAMNYTISLLDSTLPAPVFSNTSCPSATTPCFCGDSKSPFQYMTDANLLSQSFVVVDVNTTVSYFYYYYHTGLCYEIIGSEQFSLVEGQANSNGDSCFSSDVFYMNKTDGSSLKSKNITIKLFERYPEGITWFTVNNQNQFIAKIWKDQPLINWFIENSTLTILDQISGSNSNVAISYNSTLIKSCDVCHTAIALGTNYSLNANYAFPSFPYDLKFDIYAKRIGSDGTFTVDNTWYIPVLGVVAKEVPNFYPVSSDPNLIFLVIRDPPGGTSTTTIQSGSSIQFGISIDNMEAFDTTIGTSAENTVGAFLEFSVGLGYMIAGRTETVAKGTSADVLKISNTYGSTSTHDYTFSFESDFSTSDDPNIAG